MREVKEKEYLVLYKIGARNTVSPPLLRDAQKIRNLDIYKVNIRNREQRNNERSKHISQLKKTVIAFRLKSKYSSIIQTVGIVVTNTQKKKTRKCYNLRIFLTKFQHGIIHKVRYPVFHSSISLGHNWDLCSSVCVTGWLVPDVSRHCRGLRTSGTNHQVLRRQIHEERIL